MPASLNPINDVANVNDLADRPKRTVDIMQTMAEPAQDLRQQTVAHALNYDFDIVTVAPDAAQRAHLDALAKLGQSTDDIHVEARWRDPRTLAAVQSAGKAAQDVLEAAGFGAQVSESRMQAGHYPAEQGPKRHEIVMRLTNLLADNDATQFDWGDFNCMDLFKAHAEAEAVQSATSPDYLAATAQAPADKKRKIAFAICTIGIVLIGLAVASAI